MAEKKRGRGRPKGAPNKPKMKLIEERVNLTNSADVYEILCQANIVAGEDTDLGLCAPEDASVGNVPFTDGAPVDASMIDNSFPYLKTPLAGSE